MHRTWHQWRLGPIALTLTALLGACTPGTPPSVPSAGSNTPHPSLITAVSPSAPPGASATGAPSAVGSLSSGLQLTGTYEASLDITTSGSSGSTHTALHQTGSLTASGAADGTLSGTARFTYRKDYKIGGPGCKTAWNTGDVTWDTPMTGTWQANGDGSVNVSLLPATAQGPGISEDYTCNGPITEHPDSVPFGGTLVKGILDVHQDYIPSGGGSSGTDFSWATWHLESVPHT